MLSRYLPTVRLYRYEYVVSVMVFYAPRSRFSFLRPSQRSSRILPSSGTLRTTGTAESAVGYSVSDCNELTRAARFPSMVSRVLGLQPPTVDPRRSHRDRQP